jgi:opacity protein-like surface antigen
MVALILLGCGLRTADAQDDRRVGLTMGYPAAVGVVWHVTDRVAIRPEIDFSRTTATTETTSTLLPDDQDEVTSRLLRPGVSALFYVARREDLRTYVSTRYGYTSTESSPSTSKSSTHIVSASIGAQHRLGDRFAVFGELGIEYARGTFRSSGTILSLSTRRTTIATRSGAGVVLYF